VIPHNTVGRFYALFRMIDAAAGFIFNRYIFGYAETETGRKWIYISMGVLYLVAFTLMCTQVKEGQYPPPAPLPPGTRWSRIKSAVRIYVHECYSLRFFWWLYLGNALYRASDVMINNLGTLLARDIGMSVADAGKVFSWVSIAGLVLYWPLGWLSDKIHATRLAAISAAMTFVVFALSIWLVRGPVTFWLFTLLWAIAWLGYISACVPLMLLILPKDRYGQFASANAVLYAAALMAANYGGGYFVDKFGPLGFINHGQSGYSAIYWWSAACAGLSFICLLLLYRGWKFYGGAAYVPPVPALPPPEQLATA
jgi:predicted MFS family arabinose efflux permease